MRPASHMGRAAALIKGTVPTYSARGATVKRPWVMSELPYRPGVGVMLLNRQRHVFVGQRIDRSEEHTSELQSLMRISYAVFCLKKKKHHPLTHITHTPCSLPYIH